MRVILLFVFILLSSTCLFPQTNGSSWKEVKTRKQGSVKLYWFQNSPYGYTDEAKRLRGMEVEIMEGFKRNLQKKYQIELTYKWIQEGTFNEVLNRVQNDSQTGVFGLAGFSITEERRKLMKFSPSYMADIAVLVSTNDIPIARSKQELLKYMEGATALTAKGTVLEKELNEIRETNQVNFTIEHTGASMELIHMLAMSKKSFGYLSLPVYLLSLDKGFTKLNRQNYFTMRYEGRGIGLPMSSDWDEPLNEYFDSEDFITDSESIIASYVNMDLYRFIETFNPQNEVGLLNKEKDIQQVQLRLQQLELRDKTQKQLYLIITITLVSILLIIIVVLFRRQASSHRLLKEQKAEIEAQSDQIIAINSNLEATIQERTRELANKNKALEEYAFITAHKLRAPLANILGLVSMIDKTKLREEEKEVVSNLKDSAQKLDEIIHSVMNAIDQPIDPPPQSQK
ncbi:MAG: transporter substrate-binding domain-containing protein [Bacteroidetes bacterium]|nr:transporter substrate-binding domain-containing protein [Bacteroidota bacterium]